jgi:precorrin-8X/cobalt-precorrin-8 methylmutase
MKHMRGCEITEKSFTIIRERLGKIDVSDDEYEIIVRAAHTTGDIDFAKTVLLSENAVHRGIEALISGCNVVTDVEMVRTGIRKTLLRELGGDVYCFLSDPEVIDESKTKESTRSALGMRKSAPVAEGGIFAIGNAPTALFELMEMIEEGAVRPALVVGIPVGFVGALESKTRLSETATPHITNLSERGGSPIASAIVNGLIDLASGRKR